MTRRTLHLWTVATILAAFAVGCASRQLPAAEPVETATARTRVVLLRDAETDAVGRAVVTSAGETVELAAERASTEVVAGAPPGISATLDELEITRAFGSALSALPASPERFTLHFRLGSEELTGESQALVTDVMQAVLRRTTPYVTVVGHTDTTGEDARNFALGMVRAEAVRTLLLRAGLPPSSLEVISLGERDLLVHTADETSEPRNRRVEIAIR